MQKELKEKLHKEIAQSLNVLKAGGIIIYPTDTVWGLGCDATNVMAVERLTHIKQRGRLEGYIVLIQSTKWYARYLDKTPEDDLKSIEVNTKPLTIIFDKGKNIAGKVLGNDKSIAMRIPNNEFCQGLLSKFNKPIVSTSANLSGKKTPSCFSDINSSLLSSADYVVNWDREKINTQPSSILKIEYNKPPIWLRK